MLPGFITLYKDNNLIHLYFFKGLTDSGKFYYHDLDMDNCKYDYEIQTYSEPIYIVGNSTEYDANYSDMSLHASVDINTQAVTITGETQQPNDIVSLMVVTKGTEVSSYDASKVHYLAQTVSDDRSGIALRGYDLYAVTSTGSDMSALMRADDVLAALTSAGLATSRARMLEGLDVYQNACLPTFVEGKLECPICLSGLPTASRIQFCH